MAEQQSESHSGERGVRPGRLIVLSGPSGSGKSTVVARALAAGDLPVRVAVSATTRPPRPGEVDGVHYHFWTPERFADGVARGEFLEWAEVYGQRYGTLRREVEPYLERGISVLLEIDPQGAEQVRRHLDPVLVFLRPPTIEELERRLLRRRTEDEATRRRRLEAAKAELAAAQGYHHIVLNDNLDAAVEAFRRILLQAGGHGRVG
jgi:guanylate kinase